MGSTSAAGAAHLISSHAVTRAGDGLSLPEYDLLQYTQLLARMKSRLLLIMSTIKPLSGFARSSPRLCNRASYWKSRKNVELSKTAQLLLGFQELLSIILRRTRER